MSTRKLKLVDQASPAMETDDFDQELEYELLTLLSKSERALESLKSRRVAKRPVLAFELLEKEINRMAEFSESPIVSFSDGLPNNLAHASEICPQASLVHVKENRASLKTVINLYHGWTGEPAEREETFRELCRGLVITLERFFALFAMHFSSPSRSEEWVATYKVFIGELIDAISSLKF